MIHDILTTSIAPTLLAAIVFILSLPIAIYMSRGRRKQIAFSNNVIREIERYFDNIDREITELFHIATDIEGDLVTIKFVNAGDTLCVEDYCQPLTVKFRKGKAIKSVKCSFNDGDRTEILVAVSDGMVIIPPVALQPREAITLRLLLEKYLAVSIDCELADEGKLIDRVAYAGNIFSVLFLPSFTILLVRIVWGWTQGQYTAGYDITALVPMLVLLFGASCLTLKLTSNTCPVETGRTDNRSVYQRFISWLNAEDVRF